MLEMSIKEFYDDFMQGIYSSADVDKDFNVSQFFDKAIEYLIEDGTIQEHFYTPFQKQKYKVDGYDIVYDREILNLIISDFNDDVELQNLTNSDIESSVKKVLNFFEKSIHTKFYEMLEESTPGYEISYALFTKQNMFNKVNVILLSNKVLSKTVKSLPTTQLNNFKVTYEIWDLKRFYDIDLSQNKKETLVIDFEKNFNLTIPALSAANVSNSPYPSYLCVLHGNLLADLYELFGARLLEANVRSFLQLRGKVNKGIRDTINKEPEMFFAYNNGLTATAEDIEFNESNQITKLKNFQIVNGGQTTASLFNTRKKDNASLNDIFVQMKLTVINDDKVNIVIPNISRYANTQNKVNDADFFSNDIFHIRMEEKSRRIWAPIIEGELHKTKWFYERARGQYAETKAKLKTSKEQKEFENIYNKKQLFTKTDLAKYLMVWEELPQVVSRGAQKNFEAFGNIIVPRWDKNDEEFNDLYYKHAIAKIIIFKACDKIVYQQEWYGGYKANIVAYTLSSISFMLAKEKLSIDFDEIWKNQAINKTLENEIKLISEYVNNFIYDTPDKISNISEYCKKDICWSNLKDKINKNELNMSDRFKESLVTKEEHNYKQREAKKEQKLDNEVDLLKKFFSLDIKIWSEIIQWGTSNNLLASTEVQFLNMIPSGKIPSDKQAKRISQIISKLEDEGMKSYW